MTQENLAAQGTEQETQNNESYKKIEKCPYCSGTEIVKKGKREKKFEEIQVYYCQKCDKKFTPLITKNRTYPLRIITDSLTLYNKFVPLEKISEMIKNSYGIDVAPRTISNWLKEFEDYIPFLRMRDFVQNRRDAREAIVASKMFHKQIYEFKYHRAKLGIVLGQEYRHYQFRPLEQFLELVVAECPHQIFQQETKRASDFKNIFNLDGVKIIPKVNAAVKTAAFVM